MRGTYVCARPWDYGWPVPRRAVAAADQRFSGVSFVCQPAHWSIRSVPKEAMNQRMKRNRFEGMNAWTFIYGA